MFEVLCLRISFGLGFLSRRAVAETGFKACK